MGIIKKYNSKSYFNNQILFLNKERTSGQLHLFSHHSWRNKMEIKEKLKEAQLWYKRKLAMREDVKIEDIKESDMEQVEMLTEVPKDAEILTENKE